MTRNRQRRSWRCLLILLAAGPAGRAAGAPAPTAAALAPPVPHDYAVCYNQQVDLTQVEAFDLAILDPDVDLPDARLRASSTELLAYLSVGEVGADRGYADAVRHLAVGENPAWQSRLMNLADEEWRRFLVEERLPAIRARGFGGLLLDTVDAVDVLAERQPERAQEFHDGLVAVVRDLRAAWPEARLIVNRGFSVIDRLRPVIDGVLVESLFQTFDLETGEYLPVAADASAELHDRLRRLRESDLPVFVLDYADDPEVARATARRIRQAGFIPYVASRELDAIASTTVAPLPRRVLVLHAEPNAIDSFACGALAAPLNWLGLAVDYAELNRTLPAGPLGHRYRAILLAMEQAGSRTPEALATWLEARHAEGIKLIVVGDLGIGPLSPEIEEVETQPARQRVWQLLGLRERFGLIVPQAEQTITVRDPELVDFEATITRPSPVFHEFESTDPRNTVHLRVERQGGTMRFDAIVTGPAGGVARAPYVLFHRPDGQGLWYLQVFTFLRTALAMAGAPAPDVTTLDGSRVLLSHIDGDGFANRSEIPPHDYCGTMILEQVLTRLPVPVTVSVIEGEIGAAGLYPAASPALEQAARAIFALPNVEAASHTYSHPFFWVAGDSASNHAYQHLPIPDYAMSLEREIEGSVRYLEGLLPPEKQVTMVLWTGDCRPGEEAIRLADALGIDNMNGGDTVMRNLHPSYMAVAPLTAGWGDRLQILAPNQNENVYTHDWTGDKWGYRNVIETFRATGSPIRLKPIDVYYHFYSAENRQSLQALFDVYAWALGQDTAPRFASEYVQMVRDFRRTRIDRLDDGGWRIRNAGHCRTVRFDRTGDFVDLERSRGVLGFLEDQGSLYVHLDGTGRADIHLATHPPTRPYVARASHAPRLLARVADGIGLELGGPGRVFCRLAGLPRASRLWVVIDATITRRRSSPQGELELELPPGRTTRVEVKTIEEAPDA